MKIITFKIDRKYLDKQIKDSERLNEILGTNEIAPKAVTKFNKGQYLVKFRKKLNNKN